jgi:predicted GNAT superfamily acetyltransferase
MYRLLTESADGHTHLCAEVNTVPRNDRSLEFHERYGFEVVGGQSDEATGKTVSMFALAL